MSNVSRPERSRQPNNRLSEMLAVLLLGIATIGTAWCGYQASRWNQEQGDISREGSDLRIEANRPLPFADKAFDIATSNAVLEHVGSVPHQAAFVRELSRVAKRVFISVPNRYFPVEHHTAIPLLHFWTKSFELACRWLGKADWADERNLILMSWQHLASLAPEGSAPVIGHTGIRLGGFSSNLFLYIGGSSGAGR